MSEKETLENLSRRNNCSLVGVISSAVGLGSFTLFFIILIATLIGVSKLESEMVESIVGSVAPLEIALLIVGFNVGLIGIIFGFIGKHISPRNALARAGNVLSIITILALAGMICFLVIMGIIVLIIGAAAIVTGSFVAYGFIYIFALMFSAVAM